MSNITQYKQLCTKVEMRSDSISSALATFGIDPKLFITTCMETLKDPKILACDAPSVLNSIVRASQLGLSLHRELGQAYLIPYGKKCQLQIGYRGLILMMHRSGNVKYVAAEVVYDKDDFKQSYGNAENHSFKHTISLEEDRGKPIAVWSKIVLKDGGEPYNVLTIHEVEDVRKKSKATSKDSPWYTDWDEMAKKTALKRLAKYQPIKTEILAAVVKDEYIDRGVELEETQDFDEDNTKKLEQVKQNALTQKTLQEKDFIKLPEVEQVKLLELEAARLPEDKRILLDNDFPAPYDEMSVAERFNYYVAVKKQGA